ncbi:Rap1a/Tai family immunity protein [Mesorhizobium sp. LSHC412B00]|uniref:Rap1a/Tai family immunity protein n=1 Tax=Mesorhizobium sp. LSHC412B00 TaxID=1287285 RepID=UPI0012EC7CD9|nr:Rap1a/Tai family immunity protein [Mesorhizobium sp. LSHC412B00]
MNRIAAIALIVAGLFPSQALALSTQELLNACQSKKGSDDNLFCLGYVNGVADAMGRLLGPDAKDRYCPTQPTTYGAFQQAFVNWALRHPEKWSAIAFNGVNQALRATWPCP